MIARDTLDLIGLFTVLRHLYCWFLQYSYYIECNAINETSYFYRLWARPAWLNPSDWLSKGRPIPQRPKQKPERKGGETNKTEGKAHILLPTKQTPFLCTRQKQTNRSQERSPSSTPPQRKEREQQIRQTKMSDIREAQNKPLITLTGAENYLRWKSYAMSELRQCGCDWAVTGRELPTVDSIKAKLINRGFPNNQLKPNILINMLVQEEEKHNLAVAKAGGILSKLISDAPTTDQDSSRRVDRPTRKVPTRWRNEHVKDYVQSHVEKTLGIQERNGIYKQLSGCFRQSCVITSRFISLHSKQHRGLLPSHNADEYWQRIFSTRFGYTEGIEDSRDHQSSRNHSSDYQPF